MKKVCLALVWLLLTVRGLQADDGTSRFSVSGVGGTIFSLISDSTGEPSSPTESGTLYGIKVGFAPAQASFGGYKPEFEGIYHSLSAQEWSGHILRLDAVFSFPNDRRIVRFLSAGAGVVSFDSDEDSIDGFLISYGGGVKFFLSDDLALRVDLRHNFNTSPPPADMHYFELTAGLTYVFGRRTEKPPTAPGITAPVPDEMPVSSTAVEPEIPAEFQAQAPPPAAAPIAPVLPQSVDQPPAMPVSPPERVPDLAPAPVPASVPALPPAPAPAPSLPAEAPAPSPPAEAPVPSLPADVPSAEAPGELAPAPASTLPLLPSSRAMPTPEEARKLLKREFVVYFEFDKSEVGTADQTAIREIAAAMNALPLVSAIIEGHTDSKGSERYNQKLSLKRAEAVKDLLVKEGISPSRLQTRPFGESRPVADNATDEGRRLNRRTVTILLDPEPE